MAGCVTVSINGGGPVPTPAPVTPSPTPAPVPPPTPAPVATGGGYMSPTVCYKAMDDKPGCFTLSSSMQVTSITLTQVSGGARGGANPGSASYFGSCSSWFEMAIMDEPGRTVVVPKGNTKGWARSSWKWGYFYTMNSGIAGDQGGGDCNSNTMTFELTAPEVWAAGDYCVWHGEDMYGYADVTSNSQGDNASMAGCVDITINGVGAGPAPTPLPTPAPVTPSPTPAP